MSRLITLGCSHTFGNGVIHKDKQSWPAVLASLMGLKLVNLGSSGASNRFIQHQVYKTEFFSNDTVVILWTYPDRYHFFKSKSQPGPFIHYWADNKISNMWYEELHSEYNQKFDNQTIVNQVNLFLQSKQVKVYNLIVEKVFDYYFSLGNYNTLDIKFTDDYLEKYPIGIDKCHLGYEGNIAFAKDLYKLITGKIHYL